MFVIGSDEEESRKISIMVSSASSSSFNDEDSSPTFERKSDLEEPLWRRKEHVFSGKKKLNGNLPAGKNPDEEKLLTNGNYLTRNANDESTKADDNQQQSPAEFEMEQMKGESNTNQEAESDINKSTRV